MMTGFVAVPGNPISRMTVASLQDLGYSRGPRRRRAVLLPNLLVLAESGALVAHAAPIDEGQVLPVIPITLPKESLAAG